MAIKRDIMMNRTSNLSVSRERSAFWKRALEDPDMFAEFVETTGFWEMGPRE